MQIKMKTVYGDLWFLLGLLVGHLLCTSSQCESIRFLGYFPCVDEFTSVEDCDIFTYTAAVLAVERINGDPRVLNGSTVELIPIATGEVTPCNAPHGRIIQFEIYIMEY